MPRVPLILGLLMLVAQESMCNPSDCTGASNCTGPTHSTPGGDQDTLDTGKSMQLTDAACGTACHGSVTIGWSLQPQSTATGVLTLKQKTSCNNNIICCSDDALGTVDVKTTSRTFTANLVNAKNLCGDNAQIAYTVILENTSTDLLINPHITIMCPNQPSGSLNPLRPR